MTRLAWLAVLLCVTAPCLDAQHTTPPTDAELAAITARGRALAAYDYAAWRGTDAVLALRPRGESIAGYIARQVDAGWVVAFGRSSPGRDTFYVAYEAKPSIPPDTAQPYIAVAHPAPLADTGYYPRADQAINTARADFGAVKRPYNAAILPAPRGEWWVYLVPAPTVAGIWPLGADVRYRISGDGKSILERRQLHKSIIEFGAGSPVGDTLRLQAGTHTAILDDIPEDTDVFHVLTRTPRVPEFVVTNRFVYRIETDGVIKLLVRREDTSRSGSGL